MNYKKINNILGWVLWAIATFVYVSTMESTTSFWDCGEFIASSYNLEVGHPPGAPLFMLIGRFFTMFATNETAAVAINTLSALSSSFTIMFLFWSITMIIKKLALKAGELTEGKMFAIFGSAAVGALVYTFSDSFWFSAVEGEVYAMSSLFTALVFWTILKWDSVSSEKHSVRWIVLIAYLMGLSIGVHLLNLLAIPAMVFLYYFKTKELNAKNIGIAGLLSVLFLGIVQFGIIPGTYSIAAKFELLFVNGMGMAFNTGVIAYFLTITALIAFGLYYTQKHGKVLLNTALLCLTVMLIGYSTYTVIMVRSAANPPMDENNPENVFSLLSYLNREQYGSAPFLTGQSFNTPLEAREPYKEGNDTYFQNKKTGKYELVDAGKNKPNYDKATSGFLPRMWSSQAHHIRDYKAWSNFKGKNKRASNGETVKIPTFGENMAFLFNYQWGHLYWRYFMWNFAGKQTDIQNSQAGDIVNGNWISGVKAIDAARLGNQDKLPKSTTENPGNNMYFFLPLILGLIGMAFQFKKDPKDLLVLGLLFFFTGLMINFYTNPPSPQPRERDYAYVGSFYVFAIWIAIGAYALFDMMTRKASQKMSAIVVTVACLLVPTLMASENWDDHDRSGRYTARDFARNYLNSCAPNAILFTNGDNDTFPLWYVQDVERYRTDVRVVNLSLLNTDWYIQQMRRKAWIADGIPQILPEEKLRQGTNDYVPIYEKESVKGFVDVKEIINFVASDSPKSKVGVGQAQKQVDYIPSKNFKISVNKEAVLASGVVGQDRAGRILDEVTWTVNKNYIMKNDLIILDILAANNWERPIYFAITTGADAYLGLTDYFQLEGLAYRLVPYKAQSFDGQTGEINTELMYENLVNKFVWGGIEDGKVYMDEQNRRMCMNFRNNYARLAQEFIRLGQNDKAITVLDKSISSIPEYNVPYDYFMLSTAEQYYVLKEYEKGNAIVRSLVDRYEDDLIYYSSLKGQYKKSVKGDSDRSKYILQQLIMMTNDKYKDSGLAEEMQERFVNINSLLMHQ